MAVINLYPDQQVLTDEARAAMRRHKSVLVQLSTGGGKTVVAAGMIKAAMAKGSRSIFIVPRRELMRQTAETFNNYDIPHGYVSAGMPGNPFAQTWIATAGTLARRLDNAPSVHVAFIDECHFGGAELDRIIRHYQASGAWVIGLSATPLRTNGKAMGDWFDAMVCGPSPAQLIATGRLSDYRLFAPSRPDMTGIKTVAGDYAKGQLAERMEGDRVLIGNAVEQYKRHASGLLDLAFCTSLKHGEIVASMFRDAGIASAAISGAMDDAARDRLIRAFARRELQVLCSVDLLTFGFDLASSARMAVTVEAMSDLRPTKSLTLQSQKWGRVMRAKDKHAIMLDHAGNCDVHGLPDDDREWTLDGKPKRGSDREATVPARQCPTCYFVHRPAPDCPACGFTYPVASRMVEEVDGELGEVQRKAAQMQVRQAQGRASTFDQLIAQGVARGFKNPAGWARHILQARARG